MGRSPCCDKSSVKKGPWLPEEDAKMKAYIEKHGTGGNWIAFPKKAGLRRCGKSCRLRWLNYLRPDIKHGDFSNDEDKIICNLFFRIGSRWSVIAAQLPGRTDNDIKNYWNTKLKKKLQLRMLPYDDHKNTYCNYSNPNSQIRVYDPFTMGSDHLPSFTTALISPNCHANFHFYGGEPSPSGYYNENLGLLPYSPSYNVVDDDPLTMNCELNPVDHYYYNDLKKTISVKGSTGSINLFVDEMKMREEIAPLMYY